MLVPITKKELSRNSDIIISFLSKCYYIWGESDIIINGEKLTYKEHIEKFIDKEYLFDVHKLNISHAIQVITSKSSSPHNKPKSSSPPGAALNIKKKHFTFW